MTRSNAGDGRVWAFGYGSLMWDGWEARLSCLDKLVATLPGYRRAFNKLSQRNWGTKAAPCPTLNLLPDPTATCRGMAFAFPAASKDGLLAYLGEREGKNFALQPLPIHIASGETVEAFVPLYTGKNLCGELSFDERVRMILSAQGTDGTGINYVFGIASKLEEMGIVDPAVKELQAALTAWAARV
ncbi:gamma-glutamylcyclotransferase [Aquabacterium sp.]|uniref:gamma-glutamylcyclotransferase n=1 Tax=Aquabacterium sp. TaxID=1872578 RepID=UPI00378329FA